jgi:hypothetical protein
MALNITATRLSSGGGPEAIRSRRAMELVKLTGASTAVDDTGTYTPQTFVADANTIIIGGGFDISSVSSGVVTIRAKFALGNAVNHVWVAQGI